MTHLSLQYGKSCLVKIGRTLEMVTLTDKVDGGWLGTTESSGDTKTIRVPFEDFLADDWETLVTVWVITENFEWGPETSASINFGPGKLVIVPARIALMYGRQDKLEAVV